MLSISSTELNISSVITHIIETVLVVICFSLGIQTTNRQLQPRVVTAGTEVAQRAMLTVGKIKGESKRAIPNLKNKKPFGKRGAPQ